MAVTFDAVGPSAAGSLHSATWSHTCSGSNRVLLVAAGDGTDGDTLTCTYNGVSMTSLGKVHTNNSTGGFLQVWALINPASGPNTVSVSGIGSTTNFSSGSVSFNGADQATGWGTPVTSFGSSANPAVTVSSTTSGNLVAAFTAYGSSSVTTVASPATLRWEAQNNDNTGADNCAGATNPSTGAGVTTTFTVALDDWGCLAVEVKAAAGATVTPDQQAIRPGPVWLRLFKPQVPRPAPAPPAVQSVSAAGAFTLAPVVLSAQGGQTSPDVPAAAPGPAWFRLFKPQWPKPVPPVPAAQSVTASGSLTLGPLALSGAGGQSSPDVPQAEPGPSWFRLFKPWVPRPVPPVPAVPAVGMSGGLALAPLAMAAQAAQSAPDIPRAQPGPVWSRLFRPWGQPQVPPLPSAPPATGITTTGSLALAPLALSGQGAQTSPDVPAVQPGPVWLRLFRPDLYRPLPPVPATPAVSTSGSLALAPVALSGQGSQSSPDVPQVQPGPVWVRLFRPGLFRPPPVPPAAPAVSAAGSLALAPVALSGSGAQSSPDQPQAEPGPFWLRLFKPGLRRPVPPPPAAQGISATGNLALAPLALSGTAAQTSPDLPQIAPGSSWLRWFKPGLQRPAPVPPSSSGVIATGGLTLASLALAGQAGQTSPDVPAIQPGPAWLRRFRPWAPKPPAWQPSAPPPPSITTTGSLALAPLALAASGSQTSPDVPQASPGPFWLRLFRPQVPRPVPPVPATPAVQASGTLTLAPLALAATGAQTSPDMPAIQPGPVWSRLFRPQSARRVPPPPAVQGITAAGSLPLAPLSLSGQGSQSSPDVPETAPGPSWLRLFRPWQPRPVPPPPAVQAVSAAGNLALAPLALSGSGGVTGGAPDQIQVRPGPAWLRFFKPWVPRPVPPVPVGQGITGCTASGGITLAPLHLSGTEHAIPVPLFTAGDARQAWQAGTARQEWDTGDAQPAWDIGAARNT